jgi:hypothetical protein
MGCVFGLQKFNTAALFGCRRRCHQKGLFLPDEVRLRLAWSSRTNVRPLRGRLLLAWSLLQTLGLSEAVFASLGLALIAFGLGWEDQERKNRHLFGPVSLPPSEGNKPLF